MIKHKILNRYNREVIYTAEIDCPVDAPLGIKLGLSVKLAVGNGVNLSHANLSYSNLSHVNLRYANLSYVDLSYSNLSNTNLSYSDLRYSNLSHVNLRGADLSYSDLIRINLRYSNLHGTDLRGSNLRDADLSHVKNAIIPVTIGQVGEHVRTGYAIWEADKSEVLVKLGCFKAYEKEAVERVSEKYGEHSGYAMMVKAACKIARERKILNPTKED